MGKEKEETDDREVTKFPFSTQVQWSVIDGTVLTNLCRTSTNAFGITPKTPMTQSVTFGQMSSVSRPDYPSYVEEGVIKDFEIN